MVLVVVMWLAFAALVGSAANERGRSPVLWGILSLVLSPIIGFIGLIAAGGSSEVEEKTQPVRGKQSSSKKGHLPSSAQEFDPDEHEKKCPDCAEYIKLEARVCKHCGHEFSDDEVEKQIEEAKEEEVASSSGEPPKVENPIKIRDTLDP